MRRLGEPVEYVIFHWGSIFGQLFKSLDFNAKKLSPVDYEKVRKIISKPIDG